jgi:7,8-dihydropterin-6-yl-methyl-4-(beta-D-ribofuranosyl)aminobenzene 5'-phosphate synthase
MKTSIEEYYSGSGGYIHEIGIPKEVYPKYKDNFVLIDGTFTDNGVEISKGIFIIPHSTKGLEKIGDRAKLYKKVNDDYVPDDFSHELSLVFDTEKGLVVFNSCSHSGIINIMEEIKNYFGNREIYAFFGGLHMKGMKDNVEICTFTEAEIESMTDYLKENRLSKLYTGHCTGLVGFELIKKYMGEKAEYLMTGKTIVI